MRLLQGSYKAVGRVLKEFQRASARGLEGFWKVSRELGSLSRRRTRWLVGGLADPQEPIHSIMQVMPTR